MGKFFYENSLGKFYFDDETWDVTLVVDVKGEVVHECRIESRTFIKTLSETIAAISDVI